jgi:hypothetical protein
MNDKQKMGNNDIPLHTDILKIIKEDHYNKLKKGIAPNFDELSELMVIEKEIYYRHSEKIVSKCEMLLNNLLDRQQNRKIYDLFLTNKGLMEEFENFEHRIYKKKYKIK